MKCVKCGCDIGKEIGLCNACRSSRQVGLLPEYILRKEESPWYLKAPAVGLASFLAIILAIIFSYWLHYKSEPLYASNLEKLEVTSRSGRDTLVFQISKSVYYEGVLISDQSMSGKADSLGMLKAIGYLSNSKYAEFQNSVIPSRQCPASFLNANVTHLGLVPSDNQAAKILSNISIYRGNKIRIEGKELTSPKLLSDKNENNSHPISAPGISIVMPTLVTVDDAIVFRKM